MKQIVLTLCVFFAFINSTYAGELYNCIDGDGNAIVTDSPQDGMKNCALKDSYRDPTPRERAEKEYTSQRNADSQNSRDEQNARERKCNCQDGCTNTAQYCASGCYTSYSRSKASDIVDCVASCAKSKFSCISRCY